MQIEITEAELEALITSLAKCANDGLTFVEMSQKLKQYRTATESTPPEE